MKTLIFWSFCLILVTTVCHKDDTDSKNPILPTIFAWMIGISQPNAQSTTHTDFDTWCMGRYLIDLPKGTKVEVEYMTKGSKVKTLTGISYAQFVDTVAARRQELKETPHNKGGFMLVDTDTITQDCITVVSWGSEAGRRVYNYETFQYMEEHQALYIFTGRGSADEEQRSKAAKVQRSSYGELRYRAPMEIPTEAGFCINEGLIMTSTPNREEYTAVMRLPEYPDVVVALESYVTNNPGDFSNRRAMPFGLSVANYFHTKTLRNRSHSIGKAKGQEYLTRSRMKKNGKLIYHFEWKTYGIKGSLNHPYMRLTLRTEDGSAHPSFTNDKEAFKLWEHILNSLRLRQY